MFTFYHIQLFIMNTLEKNFRVSKKITFSISAISFLAGTMASAQSTVAGLRINNQNVPKASVNVLTPGNGNNKSEIKIGDKFISGTQLIIPPNTIVLLQTAGGKQMVQSLEKKVMVYTIDITAKGESHTVKGVGASIQNTVTKVVGHDYKVNNGRGSTAASHGTVFTFTDYTTAGKEQAKIKTDEGTISIIDARPVKIDGVEEQKHARKITESVTKQQTAGDAEFTTTDNVIKYASAKDALAAISRDIKNQAVDEASADDLTALADIYMEMEQYEKAIAPYRSAYLYYSNQYGDNDLTALDLKLALADALISSEIETNEDEGDALAVNALKQLKEELSYSQDDLSYVIEENDADAQDLICYDIIDIYDMIGYAYDVLGDEANSDVYYTKSDNGCE